MPAHVWSDNTNSLFVYAVFIYVTLAVDRARAAAAQTPASAQRPETASANGPVVRCIFASKQAVQLHLTDDFCLCLFLSRTTAVSLPQLGVSWGALPRHRLRARPPESNEQEQPQFEPCFCYVLRYWVCCWVYHRRVPDLGRTLAAGDTVRQWQRTAKGRVGRKLSLPTLLRLCSGLAPYMILTLPLRKGASRHGTALS